MWSTLKRTGFAPRRANSLLKELNPTDSTIKKKDSYGVYISQLIRFARVSSHVDDFNTRNMVLTVKLLRQE